MKYPLFLRISLSFVGFIGLIMVLTLLAGKALRADLVGVSKLKEVKCKLETSSNNHECLKLEDLSQRLREVNENITANEVALCAILKVIKLGILDKKCSSFKIAHELKKEIEVLKEATGTLQGHN